MARIFVRSGFSGHLALLAAGAALQGMLSGTALAQCMGSAGSVASGPPSISATDVSTTQTLELIRRRREETNQSSPIVTTAAAGADEEALPAASGKAPASSSSPKKKKAKSGTITASATPGVGPYGYPTPKSYGAWIDTYIDYERHSNLQPGQPTNLTRHQVSAGVLSGVDSTYRSASGSEVIQLGLIGGGNWTHNNFSGATTSI